MPEIFEKFTIFDKQMFAFFKTMCYNSDMKMRKHTVIRITEGNICRILAIIR